MIDGEKVVHELVLAAPPDDVFDAFVDPVRLVAWIGISADLEPIPGGRFRFEIVPGEFCEGEYVTVDRPRLRVFTWGWTALSFEMPAGSSRVEVTLRAVDDGMSTRLRLVHHDLSPRNRELHDEGWTRFLGELARVMR